MTDPIPPYVQLLEFPVDAEICECVVPSGLLVDGELAPGVPDPECEACGGSGVVGPSAEDIAWREALGEPMPADHPAALSETFIPTRPGSRSRSR